MKKITLITLLLIFQLSAFAQDITSSVLSNPGFEDDAGYDTGWILVNNNVNAAATFTDAGATDAHSGDHAGLVEVTAGNNIWELFLERTLNTTGFSGKELEISFKTKRLWTEAGAGAGKVQLFVSEPGGSNIVPEGHNGGNTQQWYDQTAEGVYEDVTFSITVPSGATELIFQLWVGGQWGKYFFDDFTVTDVAALSVSKYETASLKIYPNPTSDILNFETTDQIENIEIIDILGKTVKSFSHQREININTLKSGIYFAKVRFANNNYINRKFVKN